jgi:hypothetical protein
MNNIIISGQAQQKKWYKSKKFLAVIIGGSFILIIILALISGKGMPMFRNVPNKVSQPSIALKGWGVESGSNVKIYLNGDVEMETQSDSNGEFNVELNLNEGKNTFYAIATYKNKIVKGTEKEIEYIIEKPKVEAQVQEEKQNVQIQEVKTENIEPVQVDVQATSQPQEQTQQPTKSLSEEDQIKQLVSKQLDGTNDNGKGYIRKIEVIEQIDEGKGVFVEYNADDKGAVNLRKEGIEKKMSDIYTAIFTSGKNIRRVSVIAYYPTVDKYGNLSDSVVYKTMLEKTEADKVNWNADKYRLETDILPKVWETTLINIEFRN